LELHFMRKILLAAVFAALAVPAFADTTTWTATLATPANATAFLAGDVTWNCGQSGCVTTSDTAAGQSMQACKELAHEYGQVSAFSTLKPFDDSMLARCNKSAKK
jgi:hypothetical protein